MNKVNPFLIMFIAIPFFKTALFAQTNDASITIASIDNKATVFTMSRLNDMPQKILIVKGEDGAMHSYSGVDMNLLLAKLGELNVPSERKQILNSYMLIKAADNYSVIYAMAEVDSFFSNKQMILADRKDGKAIPDKFVPFQIITTGEKVHARLIRMVTNISIRRSNENNQ